MADTKLSALTELTTPGPEDIVYLVANPSTVPLHRRVQVQNLLTAIGIAYDGVSTLIFSYNAAFPDGDASNPSITFADDLDTGVYRIGANAYGVTLGAALALSLTKTAGATPAAAETLGLLTQTWAPTSTAHGYTHLSLTPTINQTGTSTGTYTALNVNVTETAIVGTAHYLMSLGVGGTPSLRHRRDGLLFNPLDSAGFHTGASNDLRVYHDGTNSLVENQTGQLQIKNVANASIAFFTNNLERIILTTAGLYTSSAITIFNQADSKGYYTGASDDLRVYHDGTASIVANTTNGTFMRITSADSGVTVPVHVGDPAQLEDGAIWYDSNTDTWRGRANGATVTFTVA